LFHLNPSRAPSFAAVSQPTTLVDVSNNNESVSYPALGGRCVHTLGTYSPNYSYI